MVDTKLPEWGNQSYATNIVEIVAAVLHVAAFVSVMGISFACGSDRYTTGTYVMQKRDWRGMNTTCTSDEECYFATQPWVEDVRLERDSWNPFAMVLLFEGISASFAVFYLRHNYLVSRDFKEWISVASLILAWTSFAVFVAWYVVKGQEGYGQIVVAIVGCAVASAVQYSFDALWKDMLENYQPNDLPIEQPDSTKLTSQYQIVNSNGIYFRIPMGGLATTGLPARETRRLHDGVQVLLRYAEYVITAPILFVAVISVFAVGPPTWTVLFGFVGIALCNILGWPLQILQIDHDETGSYTLGSKMGWNIRAEQTHFQYLVQKMELLAGAWMGLGLGMLGVYYVGIGVLTNTEIPKFVLVMLWTLLIGYCSFGFAGTVYYVFGFGGEYIQTVYDILSVSCKIPIAVSVCLAFLQMPGGGC